MGQSRQLRSPLPGKKRSACWPTSKVDVSPFRESIPIDELRRIHRIRVSHPLDDETLKRDDEALLMAAMRNDHEAVLEIAGRLKLKTNKVFDSCGVPKAPLPLTDSWLGAVAEDYLPDIGVFGPEDCYANLADKAMQFRELRLTMGAAILFTPGLKNNLTAAGHFIQQKPKPVQDLKLSLWKWLRTPTGIWKVNDDKTVEPIIETGQELKEKVSWLPNSPYVIARIVETQRGLCASMAMPLPCIDSAAIRKRLTNAWILSQRWSAKTNWLDLLRYRPDSVYNICCRWAIENNCDEEYFQCWQSCYSHVAVLES